MISTIQAINPIHNIRPYQPPLALLQRSPAPSRSLSPPRFQRHRQQAVAILPVSPTELIKKVLGDTLGLPVVYNVLVFIWRTYACWPLDRRLPVLSLPPPAIVTMLRMGCKVES